MNGNVKDDMINPSGSQENDVLLFIQSWKLQNGDCKTAPSVSKYGTACSLEMYAKEDVSATCRKIKEGIHNKISSDTTVLIL